MSGKEALRVQAESEARFFDKTYGEMDRQQAHELLRSADRNQQGRRADQQPD